MNTLNLLYDMKQKEIPFSWRVPGRGKPSENNDFIFHDITVIFWEEQKEVDMTWEQFDELVKPYGHSAESTKSFYGIK